jgi:acetate---CoA ligase (ADP-forming)
MSVPSVDVFHQPRSVAVIGASDDSEKIGGRPLRYMRECGFAGRVLPVNPGRRVVQGLPAWPDVRSLPEVPDVAIVAVAGARAVEAVTACAEAGVRGCVVMASGFGETSEPEGRRLQDEMVATARAAGLRMVGPNSQGLATFSSGAILSFSTMFTEQPPQDGPVAIISQSGAMCSVPYGLLRRRGVGVRYAHGTGNDADVTVGELAEAVVADPDVRLLLLYLENITDPATIERAADAALRADVPVVALMGGRSADGQRAAASHTGALASEQRVVDAFFRRNGIWRARSTTELVAGVELYLRDWPGSGTDLAVVSNSGAVCVLAADAAADHGLPLARLSSETVKSLDSVLPRFATKANPIDVTAALLTDSSLFGKVLPVLADDPAVAACFLGLPVSGRGYDFARFAADARGFATARRRPIVVASPQPDVAAEFRRQGLVVFDEEAAALSALAQYLRHRDLMAAARGRRPTARRPVPPGARMLNENDSLALLAALGLPVVGHRLCAGPAAAAAAFDDLGGGPVVVKGCTPDASHKSELGLVRLGLADRASVRAAAADVIGRMRAAGLRADGVLVAPLVRGIHEVLLGAHVDPVFGPVVVVGAGGKYTEVLPDVQLLLPPFGPQEVHAAISRLRMAPLLAGVRGEPPADVDGWVRAAVRLGDAMADPDADIVSLDANPLILTARDHAAGPGSVIVDAVVLVGEATRPAPAPAG